MSELYTVQNWHLEIKIQRDKISSSLQGVGVQIFGTCCDDEVFKEGVPRVLQVNAIGVGTPCWGHDGNVEDLNLLAVIKFEVHLRAVLYGDVADNHVDAPIELQRLQRIAH